MLRNNLAVLLELRGDLPGAEQMLRGASPTTRAAAAVEEPRRPALSRGAVRRGVRGVRARGALAPELGDDLYFKLGNIAYKRRDTARARASWEQATELNPGHQLARANLDMLAAGGMTVQRGCGIRRAREGPDGAHRRVARRPTRPSACAAGSRCACAPAACTRTTSIAACWRARPRKWSGCTTRSRSTSPASSGTRRPGRR